MHFLKTSEYPELGDHNFCRNPGEQMDSPWCFTLEDGVRREECAVAQCGKYDLIITFIIHDGNWKLAT